MRATFAVVLQNPGMKSKTDRRPKKLRENFNSGDVDTFVRIVPFHILEGRGVSLIGTQVVFSRCR